MAECSQENISGIRRETNKTISESELDEIDENV